MKNRAMTQVNHALKMPFYRVAHQVISAALIFGVTTFSFGLSRTTAVLAQSAGPRSGTAALPDGIYLYGQSAQPDQLGQGYFVFEVNQGKVMGALYMPHSSFDCAAGKFEANQLALTVVNSYDRATNPFAIALTRNSNVAAQGATAKPIIGLEGFQPLASVSQNDLRMLKTCKADLKQMALN